MDSIIFFLFKKHIIEYYHTNNYINYKYYKLLNLIWVRLILSETIVWASFDLSSG